MFGAKLLRKIENREIPFIIDEMVSFNISDIFVKEDLFANEVFQKAIGQTDISPWLVYQNYHNDNNKMSSSDNRFFSIKSNGKIAKPSKKPGWEEGYDWLEMASPHNEEYNLRTLNNINNSVTQLKPYGLSLDFFRYYTFWELHHPDSNEASLKDTCFSKEALFAFQKAKEVEIPSTLKSVPDIANYIHSNHIDKWIDFKCETIENMAIKIITSVKQINPEIKINLHAVPWREKDFDGAIKRVAGQDFRKLSKHLDLIAPMTYSKMTGNSASWIHSVIEDIHQTTKGNTPIVPTIQCVPMYNTGSISDNEFEQYIIEALKPPSSGITFWPWEDLTQNQKKILREFT